MFDENKLIADLKEELGKNSKDLSQVKSSNSFMIRMREKDKMFLQNKEAKDLIEQEQKNNEMIEFYLKKLSEMSIELEIKKSQYDDISLIKETDAENVELIVEICLIHRKLKQV